MLKDIAWMWRETPDRKRLVVGLFLLSLLSPVLYPLFRCGLVISPIESVE